MRHPTQPQLLPRTQLASWGHSHLSLGAHEPLGRTRQCRIQGKAGELAWLLLLHGKRLGFQRGHCHFPEVDVDA
jgi:hypothetical protein